ncbi:NCS2 family permease [candidate division KSB1 bacterium]|nr:NCS2 family permease [candidate division KSB1 bacterium]RQW01961.1 MAG: NCS2 family permease [candidate division KSB1 bacterium]
MNDRFFKLQAHNSSVKTEVIAGCTTFLATMYIIVVNPGILRETGMPFSGVLTATVLVSAFSSIAMGLYANNPIVLAPGMGINAFFAYSVVLGMGVSWQTALGAVFWSGIIFIVLSVFNVRTAIVRAIPKQLRYAIASGIGLFIATIGFMNAHFIVSNPATVIGLGELNAMTITFLIGLAIMAILVALRVRGALILGIAFTTILAIPIGRLWGDASSISPTGVTTLVTWQGLFSAPNFSVFFQLDFIGSLKLAMWPVIFAFLFTDMFDSLSTFIGVAEAADLLDQDGEPRHIKQSLIVDGVSTTISGLFGTSSGTSYIESATGIEEGGRTGLTAVVAGLLFIPFMFFSPLLAIVPSIATAPALVLVGVFMMKPVQKINWGEMDDAIPALLALILIPLTYSITQGIIWGFLSWTAIKLVTGKTGEISITLIFIDLFAILALVV